MSLKGAFPDHFPIMQGMIFSRVLSLATLAFVPILTSCSEDRTTTPTIPEPTFRPVLKAFADGLVSGNPEGACAVPVDALPDTLRAERTVGDGTPGSCTESAFRSAVASGGRIGFDCGNAPVTIVLTRPAKVYNDSAPEVVIDGGGMVTLSGGGTTRILYMNTCDASLHWTTPHCQDQDHPRLTVQNLTFVDGNGLRKAEGAETIDGGGAIWARGGRLKVVNCRFFRNRTDSTGADVGGGAIRAFSQSAGRPVHVVNSTFGDLDGGGNVGSNGGALSSIGTSWSVWNSLFLGNRAIGRGGNPASEGTPGGGSGGAIYNDGNTMTLTICGTRLEGNGVNAFGAAIFFVTNDRTGNLVLTNSVIRRNPGGSWHVLPGISMHENTRRSVQGSVLED
ncbi:MAG: hypothetical protein RL318_2300 [Fibrobacterota bacterium]|jgi:hypothetical protein